ncbi:UNVERIFIED_CONTAM: hypothetical protein FKN15_011610 [Acipenser sinensis]
MCRQPTASFHTADSPCSHLGATASEDNTASGILQASPQAPGQTTWVTGARTAHRCHTHADSGETKTDTRIFRNVHRQLSSSFHSAGLPCSHLRATVSVDHTALGNLQAGPQAPGQSTGVAGARGAEDTLADLSHPPPGWRSANCVPPPGSSHPRLAVEQLGLELVTSRL